MLNERYSIEASNDTVLFFGHFHLDELASLIQCYSELGYEYIYPGDGNSSLCLSTTPFERHVNNTIYLKDMLEKYHEEREGACK
jgi:hypothetical protein